MRTFALHDNFRTHHVSCKSTCNDHLEMSIIMREDHIS
jgi:hypothetical protein